MIRLVTLVVGLAALAGSAEAAITFTSTPFDTPAPGVQNVVDRAGAQMMVDDFDHPVASGYTFTFRNGAKIENRSIAGFAAAPAGDNTSYAVVPKDSYAYLTSDRALRSASVYLGSLDAYNYMAFLYNGKLVQAFSGSQLVADPDGNQTSGATNRLFDFNFNGEKVNQIAFGSTGYSFEFDNLAASAVPEPASWLLLIVGIGGIGLMLRSSRARTDERALRVTV